MGMRWLPYLPQNVVCALYNNIYILGSKNIVNRQGSDCRGPWENVSNNRSQSSVGCLPLAAVCRPCPDYKMDPNIAVEIYGFPSATSKSPRGKAFLRKLLRDTVFRKHAYGSA